MESFTVNQLGRSTSRIAFFAEQAPVAITRRKKRIAVVVSAELWSILEAKHSGEWWTGTEWVCECDKVRHGLAEGYCEDCGDLRPGPEGEWSEPAEPPTTDTRGTGMGGGIDSEPSDPPLRTEPRCDLCRWWGNQGRELSLRNHTAHLCGNRHSDLHETTTAAAGSCSSFRGA